MKKDLNKFKRKEIKQHILSGHSRIELEINNRKITEKSQKLRNILNEMKMRIHQNL